MAYEYSADWASDGILLIARLVAEYRHEGEDRLLTGPNPGKTYDNHTFTLRGHCRCNGALPGHERECPPNFHHKLSGFVVAWDKELGVHTLSNQPEMTARQWFAVLGSCGYSIKETPVVKRTFSGPMGISITSNTPKKGQKYVLL